MSGLPTGFSALERFVAQWAVDSTANRAALRGRSTPEERQAFFEAAQPLLDAALAHLDAKPLAAHNTQDRNLMSLILSFAHVSLAVEMQAEDEAKHTPQRETMRITRSSADFSGG